MHANYDWCLVTVTAGLVPFSESLNHFEFCGIRQPSKYLVKSTDYSDDFSIPVLTAGQTFILGYTNENNGVYKASKEKPVIIFDDFTGAFKWVDFPFKAKSSAMKMITAKSGVLIRYLYHLMGFLNYTSDEHKRLWISIYSELKIPLPPLEIQCEIVRILDNFTELTAELTARKKQYEYYRDQLLSFGSVHGGATSDVQWMTLGEIAIDIFRGSGIKRDQVTEDGIPCVRYGEIYTTYNTWFDKCVSHTKLEYVSNPKYFEHGDILFAITGESVEDIAKSIAYVGHEKCLAGGDIVVLKHNQNPRYLAHVLATQQAREQKSKGKVKSKVVHSNIPSIEQIRIPLPPIDVQNRYADVLDNFEIICNDLNIGLPKEIELRKKQYEFYRDCLLTYAETGAIISKRREEKRREEKRREEKRREEKRREEKDVIRLIQYVFRYVSLPVEDIFDMRNGYTPSKSNSEYWTNGTVDWFKMEDIRTNGHLLSSALQKVSESAVKKSGKFPANSIALATSATIGEHALITVECLGNQRFTFFSTKKDFENIINMRYMNYYFYKIDDWCKEHLFQGNFNTVDIGALKKLLIPIPSTEEQNRIVSILDRFDTLCNNISEGLPAEIEARRKQYEYYRDKLLNFTEVM